LRLEENGEREKKKKRMGRTSLNVLGSICRYGGFPNICAKKVDAPMKQSTGYALGRGRRVAGGWVGRAPWKGIGLSLSGGILLLAFACSGTLNEVPFNGEDSDVYKEPETVSFQETAFRFAMVKLENGDFEGARETLNEIEEPEEDPDLASKVAFALGVLKLLKMENMESMRECRRYFQAYAEERPGGPYRENAERIVKILNTHIQRTQRDQRRLQELTQQASEREKVIQTLQYKIEKLEEIHRETEEKRHLLDGE
jgi:hypothetical protein